MAEQRRTIGDSIGLAIRAIKSRAVAVFLAARSDPAAQLSDDERSSLLGIVWKAIAAALAPVSPDGSVTIGTQNDAHGDPQLTLQVHIEDKPVPVAAYQFGRGKTLGLIDTTGNGHALAVDAGVEDYTENSVGGTSFDVAGTARLKAGLSEALQLTGDLSIELVCQIQTAPAAGHQQYIVACCEQGETEAVNILYMLAFLHTSAGEHLAYVGWDQEHGDGEDTPAGFGYAPVGRPFHLLLSRKNSVLTCYLNGVQLGDPATLVPPTGGSGSSLYLGDSPHTPDYDPAVEPWVPFTGLLDYVAIYNEALSSSQAQLRYQHAVDTWAATEGGGGGTVPTGTGWRHVTNGAEDAAASTPTASDVGAIATTARGAANGVASLDASTTVPTVQIPQITEDKLSLSDVTTGNASASMHGLAPKGDGDPSKFLAGDLVYRAPVLSGGGRARIAIDASTTACWKMDDAISASTLVNEVSGGSALSKSGTLRLGAPGVFAGKSLHVPAGDNRAYSAAGAYQPASAISVSAWIRLVAYPTGYGQGVSKTANADSWSGNGRDIQLAGIWGSGTSPKWASLVRSNYAAGDHWLTFDLHTLPLHEWCLHAVTFDGTTATYFVNGESMASYTWAGAGTINYENNGRWVIGNPAGLAVDSSNTSMDMFVDDLRIDSVARNAAFWLAMYKAGLAVV